MIRTCLHPLCDVEVARPKIVCGAHWHRIPNAYIRQLRSARSTEARGAIHVEIVQYFESRTIGNHEIVDCRFRGCGTPIVFLPTKRGKSMPVDADTVRADDELYDGDRHASHFGTCVARQPMEGQ